MDFLPRWLQFSEFFVLQRIICGVLHAKRLKDIFVHELFQRKSGDNLNYLPKENKSKVTVSPFFPDRKSRGSSPMSL